MPDPDVGAGGTEETEKDPFLVYSLLYCLSELHLHSHRCGSCSDFHLGFCSGAAFSRKPALTTPTEEIPFLVLFTLPDFSLQLSLTLCYISIIHLFVSTSSTRIQSPLGQGFVLLSL